MSNPQDSLVLESNTPLSQSMIWKLQADFYAMQGPEAWSKGIVPQYITTNPYFANLYAKTVFAYCRDLTARQDFKEETTVYILELAAGIGRFTYSFLQSFTALLENSTLKNIKFKYIVSDFAKRNVVYWQNHPSLKPYFEKGILDCAIFDMTKDTTIELIDSGVTLNPGTLNQPLILLANYTFDSLPIDTFYVKEGILHEGLINLSKKSTDKTETLKVVPTKVSILSDLDYEYSDRVIDASLYYTESIFNEILHNYQASLPDGSFTLPVIAFQCLQRLITVFGDDLVLISADKGYNDLKSMNNTYHPFLSEHGSISLMVNFHAIELFFQAIGGNAHHSIYQHDNITLSMFTLGKSDSEFSETVLAFREAVEGIGPDDFHTIKKVIVTQQKTMTLKELLIFLRYTHWDSRTFLELYNTLLERISEEENYSVDQLITALYKVWENYFPIGEEGDLSYCLGTLFTYFGYDHEAIELFETSIYFYGESADLFYEIALCYYNLQDFETSKLYITRSLNLDAGFEEAQQLENIMILGS